MPVVGSIAELNALLEEWDDADDRRRIGNRANSVGHDWSVERELLRPLPAEPFDTALTLTPRVDRYAQLMVRCNQYSVPARFIGHRLRVKLSASTVTVYNRNTVVARHQRAIGKGVKVLDLTTIWRSCCASPARCPAPLHSPKPARAASSPMSTTRSGPRHARRSATPQALGR
jgi:hypothetical protein